MSIQLSPDVAKLVQEQIASGRYASENDVLRDAMKALHWHRQEVAAIGEGIDDMLTGRYRSIADADDEIRRRHNLPPCP